VVLVDLTSRTPPYDIALGTALKEAGCAVELWAAGCHGADFEALPFERRRGWSDLGARLPDDWKRVTKAVKAAEYLVNLAALAAHVRRTRPDVVHIHWLPLLETWPAPERAFLDACRRWGVRVVQTVHDLLPLDGNGEAHRAAYRAVYRRADALVCHTQQTQQRLVREFGVTPARTHVVPHGPLMPEVAHLDPASARHRAGWTDAVPTVLLFGVLRPYKGADVLLRAWQRVEQALPHPARLVLAGSAQAAYADDLDRLAASLGLQGVETRYRYLPNDELQALIAGADVLVYPYRNITQSGALFAGMSAGKPIVAARVGGLAETLTDGVTARLVAPEAPEALAQALLDVMRAPDAAQALGQRARKALADDFAWSAIAAQTMQLYRPA
jgi:glycosyltransferase involved in cell wall biosynthesis